VSEVDNILAGVGDAADILTPPADFAAFVQARIARSRDRHPSTRKPEPSLVVYDLDTLLEEL
jgi:hypothetical protein